MLGRNDSGGVFVVFEGIDGAGTTTQVERYAAYLRSKRRMVHVTREPTSGPIGTLLRLVLTQRLTMPGARSAEIMSLLFAADRLDHLESEIEPLLRDGYVVLSDRYDLSSLLYQSTSASDPGATDSALMLGWIRQLNRFARRPDATIILDVDADVAAARRRARGGARELYEDPDFQKRLARGYQNAEALAPDDRIVHVDGNADLDTVTRSVVAALEPFVGL